MTFKIAIVGEAYGAEEETQRQPFVGASGWHLTQMLEEAGIHRADCFLTNVFNLRPPGGNDVENLCTDKANGLVGLGPLVRGKYLQVEYAPELQRLAIELRDVAPNITIALGNTAAWALLSTTGISKIRGTVTNGVGTYRDRKVLPTFHPAAVLRDFSLRPVTVLDLAKAGREREFSEVRRPHRQVYLTETLDDLEWYYERFIANARSLSFDIETSGDQITCIGFGPDKTTALVVAFRDVRQITGSHVGSFWPTQEAEMVAWRFVRRVLRLPMPKYGQNTLYDINFLWVKYGLEVVNYADDTMLLHHALQPESLKGLGFLGSVYTNESSWKLMNRKDPTAKREK